jgi:hypothetical protein
MIISEVVTLGIYALSMVFLPEYFGVFCLFHFSLPHFISVLFFFPLQLTSSSALLCFRSIIRGLSAVWMESRCYRCDKRATSVDHQGDQESRRT